MFKKLFLLLGLMVLATAANAQLQTGCQQPNVVATCLAITTSGNTSIIPNFFGGMNTSFEETITGAPATVSITIQGCAPGGTCDAAMDTYTTVANAIRAVTPTTKVYSYFKVTATWTGGTNPTVLVTPMLTTARGGGGGASGTITSSAGAANAYYAGAGTTISPDTNIVDNGSGTMTFGAGVQLTAAGITSATTNGGFTIGGNGTGLVVFPNGTATNPAWNHTQNATNTGWFSGGANAECFSNVGTAKSCFNNSGNEVGSGACYIFSQSNSATGTGSAQLCATGTVTTQYMTTSTPVVDLGKCVVNALAISNTQTTVCSFTLPNASTTETVDCYLKQIVSTSTTLALGYQFAQAPTNPSFTGQIWTTNTNTMTDSTNTTGSTTANTIVTDSAPGATGTFKVELHANYTSSATSGTLVIFATAGAVSDITMTGSCEIH